MHCIVWAKELLFPAMFGDDSQASDLEKEGAEVGRELEASEWGMLVALILDIPR